MKYRKHLFNELMTLSHYHPGYTADSAENEYIYRRHEALYWLAEEVQKRNQEQERRSK